MGLKLFNTLSRSVQEFAPLDAAGEKAGIYSCGPTVHDVAHIGNFRTFVFADLVRRYLQFKGYAVTHVMNSAVHAMKRHDMAVESYYGVMSDRPRAVILLSGPVPPSSTSRSGWRRPDVTLSLSGTRRSGRCSSRTAPPLQPSSAASASAP